MSKLPPSPRSSVKIPKVRVQFGFSYLIQYFDDKLYLFDQTISENAEKKDLGQGITQIADHTKSVHVGSIDFCGLVCQQGQFDG